MLALQRRSIIVVSSVAVILLAALAWLLVSRFSPPKYHGSLMEPKNPVADFELVGSGGKAVKLSSFQGKLVVLYFGYTFCPDVCPTTLAELARGMKKLGRSAEEVQVIMVTVDPERDTPDVLAQYVAHFDSRFLGLSGTAEQIAAAAKSLGIYYQKHEGTAASGYLVDHTASVNVIDRNGYLRLVFSYGTPGEDIASDLANLLR
jgi:protein SCO1/2